METEECISESDTNTATGTDDVLDTAHCDDEAEECSGDDEWLPMRKELDETIANGCTKNNLSVTQAKKILKSVVRHDLVKEMLVTMLTSCGGRQGTDGSQSGVTYEPRLTRSKMKHVLEKRNDHRLWPMSPVKPGLSDTSGPSILDMEFSDEDDDDYEPSKDVEDADSDDDDGDGDNLFSPQMSNVDSALLSDPAHSIPMSMSANVMSDGPRQEVMSITLPLVSTDDGHLSQAPSPPKDDYVAGRTRSKQPLTTTSLYDIEEAFVAPDITPDMYDIGVDDGDWNDFLKSLHKPDADLQNESAAAEEDDPEFNYIEEAEGDLVEPEEARFDGPFRVSRNEVNTLLKELEDLFDEEDCSMIDLRSNLATVHENAAMLIKDSLAPQSSTTSCRVMKSPCQMSAHDESSQVSRCKSSSGLTVQSEADVVSIVSDRQLLLIQEQMRKHVQLAAQNYLLCQCSEDYWHLADTHKVMMSDLQRLADLSVVGKQRSYFYACNLDGATEFISRSVPWQSHRLAGSMMASETQSTHSITATLPGRSRDQSADGSGPCNGGRVETEERSKGRPRGAITYRYPLLELQKEMMWSSPVFIYPMLLPTHRLMTARDLSRFSKTSFSVWEDALLVYGKDEFSGMLENVFSLIHRLLMPAKTAKQIRCHFHHIKNRGTIIGMYKWKGVLPEAPSEADSTLLRDVRPPCDRCLSALPAWCKNYRSFLSASQRSRRLSPTPEQLEEHQRSMKLRSILPRPISDGCSMTSVTSTMSNPAVPVSGVSLASSNSQNGELTISTPLVMTSCMKPSAIITSHGLYVAVDLINLPILTTTTGMTSNTTAVCTRGENLPIGTDQGVRDISDFADGTVQGVEEISSLTIDREQSCVPVVGGFMDAHTPVSSIPCGFSRKDVPQSMSIVSVPDNVNQVTSSGGQRRSPPVIQAAGSVSNVTGSSFAVPIPACSLSQLAATTVDYIDARHQHVGQQCLLSHTALHDTKLSDSNGVMTVDCAFLPSVSEDRPLGSCPADRGTKLLDGSVAISRVDELSDSWPADPGSNLLDGSVAVSHVEKLSDSGTTDCSSTSGKECRRKSGQVESPLSCSVVYHVVVTSPDDKDGGGDRCPMARGQDVTSFHGLTVDDMATSVRSALKSTSSLLTSKHFSSVLSSVGQDKGNNCISSFDSMTSTVNITVNMLYSSDLAVPSKQTLADVAEAPSSTTQDEPCGGSQPPCAAGTVCCTEPGPLDVGPVLREDAVSTTSNLGSDTSDTCRNDCMVDVDQPPNQIPGACPLSVGEQNGGGSAVESRGARPRGRTDCACGVSGTGGGVVRSVGFTPDCENASTAVSSVPTLTSSFSFPRGRDSLPLPGSVVSLVNTNLNFSQVPSSGDHSRPCKYGIEQEAGCSGNGYSPSISDSLQMPGGPKVIASSSCTSVSTRGPKNSRKRQHSGSKAERAFKVLKGGTFRSSSHSHAQSQKPAPSRAKKGRQTLQKARPILPKSDGVFSALALSTAAVGGLNDAGSSPVYGHPGGRSLLPRTGDTPELPARLPLMFDLPRWTFRGRRRICRDATKKKDGSVVVSSQPSGIAKTYSLEKSRDVGEDGEVGGGTGRVGDDDAVMPTGRSQDDDGCDDGDSYLNQLMTASSTIGYNACTQRSRGSHYQSKNRNRKARQLAVLDDDVIESDPAKDERDMVCAQAYLNKVKLAMRNDPDVYLQFMDLLRQFEAQKVSPLEAYGTISKLLERYPEIQDDFSQFMLPQQAFELGCQARFQSSRAVRVFLRRLELFCGGTASEHAKTRYRKILHLLSRWTASKGNNSEQLRDSIISLMRSMPSHLVDDFNSFCPDVRPGDGQMKSCDFEEITFGDSGEDVRDSPDDFEDLQLDNDEDEVYLSDRCPCKCHLDTKKRTHCFSCCLKVMGGRLFFQPSNNTTRRPATATYYSAVSMTQPAEPLPRFAQSRTGRKGQSDRRKPSPVDVAEDDDHDMQVVVVEDEEDDGTGEVELEGKPDTEEDEVMEDLVDEFTEEDDEDDAESDRMLSHDPINQSDIVTAAMLSACLPSSESGLIFSPQPSQHSDVLLDAGVAEVSAASACFGHRVSSDFSSSVMSVSGASVSTKMMKPVPATFHRQIVSVLSSQDLSQVRPVVPLSGKNSRMRKRIMGLRPSCHVSPSVQQKSSRGAVSGGMGVLKVLCSDNTVIMYNSSSLFQSQHVSYPNNTISVSTTLSTTAPLHEYLQASNDLPDISSPAKSIQRGNFSGILKSREHEGTPSRSSNVVWCDVSGTCRDFSTSTFNPLNTYGKQPSAVPHVSDWLASPLRREPSVGAAQCGSCENIGLVHNVTDAVYGARCSTQTSLTSSPVSSAACGEEAGYDLPVPRPAVMSDDTVNALFADMMDSDSSGDSGNRQSSDDVTPASVGLSRVSCAEQDGIQVIGNTVHSLTPACAGDDGGGDDDGGDVSGGRRAGGCCGRGEEVHQSLSSRADVRQSVNRPPVSLMALLLPDWTRDCDRRLLKMVRDFGYSAATLSRVASEFGSVTARQVDERLSQLMDALGTSDDESPAEET